MEEYKSNSNRSKEETQAESPPEKKVEKVVTGPVKVRKKSEFQKMAGEFISKDVNSVKSYILMDVLIPAVKKAISDIIRNGIDMLLYGESGSKRETSSASRVSYRSYYDKPRNDDSSSGPRARVGYGYDDIVFSDRPTAEDVLSRMDELINTYSVASVADLYDLAGVDGPHTNNNYGWTNISAAQPLRVRDGYIIKFPPAMPIK
jgi:hypothetical protein